MEYIRHILLTMVLVSYWILNVHAIFLAISYLSYRNDTIALLFIKEKYI